MIKYVHDEIHHNLEGPSIIVPIIMDMINPKSVVDVGCGIGTFLNIFKKNGVQEVLGLDGGWTDRKLLSKYISLEEFQEANLEKLLEINKKYDVAICLEVAEHLSLASADTTIENLTNLSDYVVFSAAFPGQGGQNHLNEQWPTYWKSKFNKMGYEVWDIFRPLLWDIEAVPDWYKQNMFLAIRRGKENDLVSNIQKRKYEPILNYVHPNYFSSLLNKSNQSEIYEKKYNDILKGKSDTVTYAKIIAKFILRKIKLYNK
jgi:SAM-dependent methyltransferase